MTESSHLSRRQLLKLAAGTPLTLAALSNGVARASAGEALPYRDASLPVPLRVADLLGRMTLDEKVAQMITLWATKERVMDDLDFSSEKANGAYPDGFGQLARPSDKRGGPGTGDAAGGTAARWRKPEDTVDFINAVQRWAIEETRLGIPVLFHEESLHGYMARNATMFPQAIALAGTFDPDLMREISSVIAREVRAHGVPFVLSPVVDIARDPRWGRIEETFGEDPFLTGEMGVAAVEGLQGAGKPESLAPDKVFATLKHMTGHGQPESGNNISPAQISERELRANFFPPFRSIVNRTAIRSVMPSYNEIDGVPSHANSWLLQEVLRDEWGFDGVIVSDYNGITDLVDIHHIAADYEGAARLALAAGVDSELPDDTAYGTLAEQVRDGRVEIAQIDLAVTRILELKFRAGLFENPFGDFEQADRITGNTAARELALTAARKSLCLLKNDGTLPLQPGPGMTVAVIGPNAAIARLGGYSSVPRQSVTLLQAMQDLLQGQARVVHAQGVHITQSEDRSESDVQLGDPRRNRELISQAVEVGQEADIIVLAIGDTEQTSREAWANTHLGDRTSLDLPGQQNELFDALRATGMPIVVCAINGRPPSWPNIVENANAILECWYPGQEGGTAIAEALLGIVNPGAKLPVTVPRSAGHVPQYYNHKPSGRRGYLFSEVEPLFPFGFGLSYSRFETGAPRLSSASIVAGESVEVRVDVINTGPVAGDEVVQIYVHDPVATITQPVRLLKAFQRVTLQPGEQKTVRLILGPDAFTLWNLEMREVIEPGAFSIMAGPNSRDLQETVLEIVAAV